MTLVAGPLGLSDLLARGPAAGQPWPADGRGTGLFAYAPGRRPDGAGFGEEDEEEDEDAADAPEPVRKAPGATGGEPPKAATPDGMA